MRKVFLSNIILGELKKTKYISDDFELPDKAFNFMMSYFIDMNTRPGDDVAIITCYTSEAISLDNYEQFKCEAKRILEEKNAKCTFIDVQQKTEFDSLTFTTFFKKIAKLFQNDDVVYLDLTYGLKPYSIGLFIAAAYAVKAAENVRVETIVYAKKYTGQEKPEEINASKIYDITSLFYLNEISGNLHAGEKESADKVLDLLISDNE